MSIESELKKEGIVIIKPLDTLTVNQIAKKISTILCNNFPNQNLDENSIFISISRLNMYLAKMPNDNSMAKYFYKNSSIYFKEDIDIENIDKYAIHECIHVIQSKKDSNNKIIQLGLCDFSNSKLPGIAINEAAVQFMTEKCLNSKPDNVKYFGIDLEAISPDYYPLECSLVSQMAYITGNDALYNSTLFGTPLFQDIFTYLTNKTAYKKIEKNIDSLMNLEDKLAYLNLKLSDLRTTDKAIFKTAQQISDTKRNITNLYLQTQNLIMTSYFDSAYQCLNTSKDIENFRNKLYLYKNYIGSTEDYTFYNEYYLKMMQLLEAKYELINNISHTDLTLYKPSFFKTLIHKIAFFFVKEVEVDDSYENRS